MRPIPRLYLGTMTFGWSQASSAVDEAVACSMVRKFLDHDASASDGLAHIDSARIYAGGKTEMIVGSALCQLGKDGAGPGTVAMSVGTKAHPSQPGGLSPSGMRNQLRESLGAMSLPSVGEFYLHQPDTEHSLLDSLRCAHELKTEGLIETLGMSNYHAAEVERAFDLCEEHGLTKPGVYQGLYNPLNRLIESDLLPVLRRHGCRFVAYNPLAAGLLTGKHSREGDVQRGRFKDNPNYLPRFYTPECFDAIDAIRDACDAGGISMVEATFRWLLCHSALAEGDGVLLGASSTSQLESNLAACGRAATSEEEGSLPDPVLRAMDDAWRITSEGAFPYWRSFSLDMPRREQMDQGWHAVLQGQAHKDVSCYNFSQ